MTSRRSLAVAALVSAATIGVMATATALAARERSFASAAHGIRGEAPSGWELSRHSGFPEILAVFTHGDGSRISVAAAPTTSTDARRLADSNRRGLEAHRFRVGAPKQLDDGTVELESRAPGGELVRQSYRVRPFRGGRQAVIVTLTTPSSDGAAQARAFGALLRNLELEAGEDPADGGTRDSGSGGS